MNVLEDFYCPAVLNPEHVYSPSGEYCQISTDLNIKVYVTTVHFSRCAAYSQNLTHTHKQHTVFLLICVMYSWQNIWFWTPTLRKQL